MLCPSTAAAAAAAAAAALLKEGPTVAKQAASSSCLNDAPLPVTPSVTTSLHEIGLQTSKNWLQHPLQPLKCDPVHAAASRLNAQMRAREQQS